MNISVAEILKQFNRVKASGWLAWFQENAKRAGTTTAHLLAIGSRETNLKNIRGDYRGGKYHGYGVMQVDIGTDAQYARTWTPENVEPSIRRGVDIFISKCRDTQNSVGKRVSVRNRFFTGKKVDAADLRRISTAAYNCGRWAHYHFSSGNNCDSTTTGKDYSRDVYDRAVYFADLLEKRGIEPSAVYNELNLQGKYARMEHLKIFGAQLAVERVKLPIAQSMEADEVLSEATYERETDLLEIPPSSVNAAPVQPTVFLPPNSSEDLTGDALNQFDLNSDSSNANLIPDSLLDSLPEPAPNTDGKTEITSKEEIETGTGTKTLEVKTETPAGDAAEAKPRWTFNVEDWKPWVFEKLKLTWKSFGGANLSQGMATFYAAIKAGEYWYVPLIIGGVLFLTSLFIAILISLVLLAIWYFNRREITDYKTEEIKARNNPQLFNFGIEIEKKI